MSTAEAGGDREADVLFRRDGRAAHVVLNRPRALNALTLEMVGLIHAQLEEWAHDDTVGTVVLTGAGERGLCAGGDIMALWADVPAGGRLAARFWAAEYRLISLISRYPRPFVAVMDGIVLGGGIGLSAHAAVRIVTERSSIGMPETGIGFLPDVGGTYLLARAPGEIGTHLALTGGSVGAGDAVGIGLADHYVPSDRVGRLLELLAVEDPRDAVAECAEPAPEAPLLAARTWIDPAYAGDDAAAIAARLAAGGPEAARAAGRSLARRSPTSVTVTLRAIRQARRLPSLEQVLVQDYRLVRRLHALPDFTEGVRAQIVDKDRNPTWNPPTLELVSAGTVDDCFAPLDDGDLDFDNLKERVS
jgi:enoyl-CoA hydratase/carnithine racemase